MDNGAIQKEKEEEGGKMGGESDGGFTFSLSKFMSWISMGSRGLRVHVGSCYPYSLGYDGNPIVFICYPQNLLPL